MPSSARQLQERPPCPSNEGMTTLDRTKFNSTLDVLAVRVGTREISAFQREVQRQGDVLHLSGIKTVLTDETAADQRWCLLRTADRTELTPETRQLLEGRDIQTRTIDLTYDFWSSFELIHSILPEDLRAEAPQGFSKAGHLIHLNLKNKYLPFKYAIAQILQDKNSGVRTVVNKIETINESEFRTFPMEVLAGPPDFEVTMPESGCEFTFDFSRVYWNSRLSHEHERLIALFKKGDIIADVMAGVGPFVVPAAKRGCFVFANDLNPESTRWLDINRKKNKISEDTLRITTLDGKAFIQRVVGQVGAEPFKPLQISAKSKSKVTGASKVEKQGTSSKSAPKAEAKASPPRGPQPHLPASPYIEHRPSSPYIKHFIMNLPATAITFLGAFRGSYAVLPESERAAVEMPIVHCHYFDKAPLAEDHTDEKAEKALMELASHYLGHPIDAQNPGFYIHKVRLVAPNKWMYCIGFELPREVAFAEEAA